VTVHGFGASADTLATISTMRGLGVKIERAGDDVLRIHGVGLRGLQEPEGRIDVENAGTLMRLLPGILAGQMGEFVLDGDASIRRRPMGRIAGPLAEMGVALETTDGCPPVRMHVTGEVSPVTYRLPVASAQVKSCVLLAGLFAERGMTVVEEPVPTRDHTERMLRARGVAVDEGADPDGRHTVRVAGPTAVAAVDETVPSDPSAAAFWLVAASIHPDAELRLDGVSTNPTRRAIIDILRRMGADIEEHYRPATGGADGEPLADLVVRSGQLRAIDLSPADVAAAIDEIPILALAAAVASGTSTFRGAGELRHKESDRIAGIAVGLAALGARVEVDGDDLTIHGGASLSGAATDSLDDHRLAMTFAIAGLVADGETAVRRPASAAISYPGFFADLERVRS
jgi:3-phosphoshikimate 1-carboxyvinyltransferase